MIGQQTNSWFKEDGIKQEIESVQALMSEYQKFNLGEKYKSTFFWRAAYLLQQTINPGSDQFGIMWSNLVRVDHMKKRAEVRIEDLICIIPLLKREIEIVKPDVVVFFTGPDYEERLVCTFPGVRIKKISEYDLKHLAQLEHSQLPSRTFRTYHPGYLSRQGLTNHVITKIAELVYSA